MPNGVIKWYNNEKGYGFILPDAGGADVFVHASAIQRSGIQSINEGDRVEFQLLRDKRTGKFAADGILVTGRAETLGDILGRPLSDQRSTVPLREPEGQRGVATIFAVADDTGMIDVEASADSNRVQTGSDAEDRHVETVRLTRAFCDLYDPHAPGANSLKPFVDDAQLLLDALGRDIGSVRPGLLIPRGEAVRQLKRQQEHRDVDSDLPSLSDSALLALAKCVAAYNVFVALDPALARRDEAILGPDVSITVDPNKALQIARSAVDNGLAVRSVLDQIDLESRIAPGVPDNGNRNSRRLSETVKNFLRVAIARAVGAANGLKAAAKTTGKVMVFTSAAVGLSYGAAQWTIANEVQIRSVFSGNQVMMQVIDDVVGFLKSMPTK